ncbi:SSI family serine proteinase inhibitor [Streptomyces sp. 7-21]|jgi:hypothetical protein|uniref:SSI family serine proteinase inhibitor n=1 Tax=Streptomyces sp. 7-21 TaxID=2802283 RepID=UPI00191EDD26|nr:SSI family serine proteinase inhibitor [Streptomyces sp. 7-21]MBL1067885.1 hypothetical protein [Streptomyces sp. 7-21]
MRTRLAAAALPLAAASALGLAAAAPAHAGGGTAADPRLQHPYHVVITVTDSGEDDGTYELYCDPVSGLSYGQHPEPGAACDALLSSGQPFEPVSSDALCTYMYGGPARAHVSGTWAGEPVEAAFTRDNGCEIDRWNRLVPALPRIGGEGA